MLSTSACKAGFDDVVVDADGAPFPPAIGGFDQHARFRPGAGTGVQNAHLVIGKLDFFSLGNNFASAARNAQSSAFTGPSPSATVWPFFRHAHFTVAWQTDCFASRRIET